MQIVPYEEEEANTLAEWLRLKGLKFAHIPNETFTKSWKQKNKNKTAGVSPGVPDYMIITPKGLLFIELKRRKGGVLSPAQKKWIDALNKLKGVQAEVCKGAEEAINTISRFL